MLSSSPNSLPFRWCCKTTRLLTYQAVLIHHSVETFLTPPQVLIITTFCTLIYRSGRRLSSFRLTCNFFVIIPVAASTDGTNIYIYIYIYIYNKIYTSVEGKVLNHLALQF